MTPTTFYFVLALLIVGAVLIILFMFRDRLKSFVLDLSRENATLKMETHEGHSAPAVQAALSDAQDDAPPARLKISGLRQTGEQNRQTITATEGEISDLQQDGDSNVQTIKQPGSTNP